jgi:pimeloyl-ACP methyl ester carboxylesterase
MLRWTIRIIAALIIIVGLTVAWVLLTSPDAQRADATALAALASDSRVAVEAEDWQVFRPASGGLPEHGLIFYPGGFAEPAAYAPLLRQIAAAGYLVVNTPAPFDLALFAQDEALAVMDAYPEIRSWTLAGHSMGGAVAGQFAAEHKERLAGLVLWAAYPFENPALAASGLPVTSIYASADTFATVEEIEAGKAFLPTDTQYLPIEGGDHYQFGNFAGAPVNASISLEEQHRVILKATLGALNAHRGR